MAATHDDHTYHLHRYYKGSSPRFRFAATIVADNKHEHGFRVEDFDPVVADSGFWAKLSTHLEAPALIRHGGEDNTKTQSRDVQYIETVGPDDPRHFDEAIRRCLSLYIVKSYGRTGGEA